jgi:hypothetical protein
MMDEILITASVPTDGQGGPLLKITRGPFSLTLSTADMARLKDAICTLEERAAAIMNGNQDAVEDSDPD